MKKITLLLSILSLMLLVPVFGQTIDFTKRYVIDNIRGIAWQPGTDMYSYIDDDRNIMLVNAKDDAINFDNDKATANVKGAYNTYWALLGGGIGLTVVGTVFTGFMGYHYVRTKKAADDTVSFNISPTSASLSLSF